MSIRPIKFSPAPPPPWRVPASISTAFGFGDTDMFDPFLMMDDFNDDPEQYLKGFPWHPHRGIETITYVLKGNVDMRTCSATRGC